MEKIFLEQIGKWKAIHVASKRTITTEVTEARSNRIEKKREALDSESAVD